MREFRRSGRFGLIGVFVVAAIVIAVALSADSTDPNPKLQLGVIFGVIAAFVAVLLLRQRGDIRRAAWRTATPAPSTTTRSRTSSAW